MSNPVIKVTQVNQGCGSGCAKIFALVFVICVLSTIFFPHSTEKKNAESTAAVPTPAASVSHVSTPAPTAVPTAATAVTTTSTSAPTLAPTKPAVAPPAPLQTTELTFPRDVVAAREIKVSNDNGIMNIHTGAKIKIIGKNGELFTAQFEDSQLTIQAADFSELGR